jgi:hypothetical protein
MRSAHLSLKRAGEKMRNGRGLIGELAGGHALHRGGGGPGAVALWRGGGGGGGPVGGRIRA